MRINQDALVNQLFGGKDPNAVPVILVRRTLPHPITHKLHENGWVGLRKVVRGGKTSFEKNHNFSLVINEDGTAEIPDCEENRTRLDLMTVPKIVQRPVMEKNARGALVKKKGPGGKTVMADFELPPLYERVDVAVLSDNLLDALLDRAERRAQERAEEDLDDAVDTTTAPGAGRAGGAKAVLKGAKAAKVGKGKKDKNELDEE